MTIVNIKNQVVIIRDVNGETYEVKSLIILRSFG